MQIEDLVGKLIAGTLGISVQSVHDDLAFSDIAEWDSLNHVNLMIALEQMLNIEIGEELMVELTSVRAIRAFAAQQPAGRP
jgi:citrate synthase